MQQHENDRSIKQQEIAFSNGNHARMIAVSGQTEVPNLLKALQIDTPRAVLLIVGGAANLDASLKPKLLQLFSRGIARAVVETGALILDGGTQSGVMEIIGEGLADRGRQHCLLGIAPAVMVSYPDGPGERAARESAPLDPNHSHFILTPGKKWGDETETRFEVASWFAKHCPVITILANGGDIAKKELLYCVRNGWPVIVIKGSERLADEVAEYCKTKPKFIEDPLMAEIIADGKFHIFKLSEPIVNMESLVLMLVRGDNSLKSAWERFAVYDLNANLQQKSFYGQQLAILVLGVLGTLFALTQTQLQMSVAFDESHPAWNQVFHYAILITPILFSILVAGVNRFKAGNKWILLRAAAEAIKREIFRYRTGVEIYNARNTLKESRQEKLARKIKLISTRLMQTEANMAGIKPYSDAIPREGVAEGDDGLSDLSPDQYILLRLDDQLNYYRGKSHRLEKKIKRFQWLILAIGGMGTFLAAITLELWIALTTVLVAAFSTYLEYQQVEKTLMKYNQAATDLSNVKDWWRALPAEDQRDPLKIDVLVGTSERVLQGELSSWVQQMQEMIEDLKEQQTKEEQKGNTNNS